MIDTNLQKYESDEIVSFYVKQTDLQPAEEYLFTKYLKPGMDILDIGVGGGRTTPALSSIAERYIGVDYSNAMVEVCSKRFPEQKFQYCDATNMTQFHDSEFDAAVFSFNGIDTIQTGEGRAKCLTEISRILNPSGVFIFSSHNARILGILPQLSGARSYQVPWRVARSIYKSTMLTVRAIIKPAFRAGEGHILDPHHGGMLHYISTPETMIPQLEHVGLSVVEHISGPEMNEPSLFFTPWHYYICQKVEIK